MIELKNITKYYNPGTVTETCVFDNFNLKIEMGVTICVIKCRLDYKGIGCKEFNNHIRFGHEVESI